MVSQNVVISEPKTVRQAPTKEYILKPGFEHNGHDENGERKTFSGDDRNNNKVMLTENQAKAFKDRFESLEDMTERVAQQQEVAKLRNRQEEIERALAEKGISIDELLSPKIIEKPDPHPSVAAQADSPDNVTPAPRGTTSDPVNAPPEPPKTPTPNNASDLVIPPVGGDKGKK